MHDPNAKTRSAALSSPEEDGQEALGKTLAPPAFQLQASPAAPPQGAPSTQPLDGKALATAKSQIEAATKGRGTDKQAIWGVIAALAAPERQALLHDSGLQAMLAKELSARDLLQAQLMLQFGSASAFPPAVTAILAAMKGAGTDEDALMQALQSLSAADVTSLKAIPALRARIEGELSGGMQAAAGAVLDGSYGAAIQRHKADVAQLARVINEMRSGSNPIHRNSAEWLQQAGGNAPNIKVHTSTHDAQQRAKRHLRREKIAYFGKDADFPSDAGNYDAHIQSTRNISFESPSVVGQSDGKDIDFFDPSSSSDDKLKSVIVHELQHIADRHHGDVGNDERYKSAEESWNRYQSEFRAYWIDGDYAWADATSGSAQAPWDNGRQKAIFDALMGTKAYAEYLQHNYERNRKVYGIPFQELVHGLTRVESRNVGNSVRVEAFLATLRKCDHKDTDLTASPLKELIAAANGMDFSDMLMMEFSYQKPLQEDMKNHLEPTTVLPHIATIVNRGVPPTWLAVNIGDERAAMQEAIEAEDGTQQKIIDTIRNATPEERAEMLKDVTIMKAIHENFRGLRRRKIMLMLEYGG